MAQPARPRPRPRLVSRQPAASSETHTIDDEDDLFRRNRGRTAEHWKQLEQSAAKATPFTISEDDWDPDDRRDTSSKPRKKKRPIKQEDRPRWQGTDVARILSSDSEDNDIQIIEHTIKNLTEGTSPNKRKRERSRSQSITPPPELTAHQRANAMNLVRQALGFQPRPPSPNFFLDDPTDTTDLDPELAKIAEVVKQRVKHTHIDPECAGGPEAVDINVRWCPHPLNSLVQEQCWTFKVRRYDTFRELFDGVADLAGVMADQLVISHNHKRVFASGTPHSLHIWAEGEMEACDKHTAEYIRAQERESASHDSPPGRFHSAVPETDVESETESTGDTIKLILRCAAFKNRTFPLTVRSTTTCGAVVKAFLKATGLSGNTGKELSPFPRLMVDGDKMDSEAEIGDTDLEDGDLVEVVGI